MKTKFILIFLSIFFCSLKLNAKIQNNIILKVENEIITNYDVKNKILQTLILGDQEINQQNIDKVKGSVLDSLIQLKLKKIELSKYNYQSDKVQINQYLERISSNNIPELNKKFVRNNISYDLFLEELEIENKWQKLIFNLYSKKIQLNEEDINKELENMLQNQSDIEEFRLSEIEILSSNEKMDLENVSNITKQIDEIGFDKVATNQSISSTANRKGDLGWVNAKALSRQIFDIVSQLKVGQVSTPIKKQDSILILKLIDKRNFKVKDIDKSKLKSDLIIQKRSEMFNLYSRSHLSKLRNTSLIEYK